MPEIRGAARLLTLIQVLGKASQVEVVLPTVS